MGYCCTPFRVDFTRLIAARGSGDRALLARVDAHLSQFFPDDESPPLFERLIGRVYAGEDPHPYVMKARILGAARQIVKGSRLWPWRADEYAEAFSAICWSLGTVMDNSEVAPAAVGHFTAVDEELKARGLCEQVSFSQLIFGGAPFDLPPADDFPWYGHMAPEFVLAADRALSSQDWSTAHDVLQPTLRRLSSWMEEASSQREGIVCFYA